jgi:protein TonB
VDLAVPEPVPDIEARIPTIPTVADFNAVLDQITATGLEQVSPGSIEEALHRPQPATEPVIEPAPDQNPQRLRCDQPAYPAIARSAMVEGTVLLNVKVGKDGRVKDVRVLGGPDLLREAAVASAWTAVFRPAVFNGQAVDAWVGFPVTFRLKAGR